MRDSTNPTDSVIEQHKDHASADLTVYFDGSCPLCSREVGFYQRRKSLSDVCWVDVADSSETDLPAGLSKESALARFHVKLSDESVLSGPPAFGAIWLRIKGFSWFGKLLQLKVLQPALELLYRLLLRIRFAILSRLKTKSASDCSSC